MSMLVTHMIATSLLPETNLRVCNVAKGGHYLHRSNRAPTPEHGNLPPASHTSFDTVGAVTQPAVTRTNQAPHHVA